MSSYKTAVTFIWGLVIGAGAVWLAPPAPGPQGGAGGGPMAFPAGEGNEPGAPGGLAGAGGGTEIVTTESCPPGCINPLDFGDGAPDGAVGAPGGEVPGAELPEEGEFTSAGVPDAAAVAGPVLLDEHMAGAEERWSALEGEANAAGARQLASDIDAFIESLPEPGARMPPLQEAVAFLVAEKGLLDRLTAAGVDVTEELAEYERILAKPEGRVKGGHDKAMIKGGKGQAPEGTAPRESP